MQVREVRSTPTPPSDAWGAGFVHALRSARAVSPVPGVSSAPAAARAPAASRLAGPQAAEPSARPRPSLWERVVGWLGDVLKGVLDFVRSSLDAALRSLGGR